MWTCGLSRMKTAGSLDGNSRRHLVASGRAGEAEGKLGGCLHWLRGEWEGVGGEEKAEQVQARPQGAERAVPRGHLAC